MKASIQAIGDWKSEIGVPMKTALAVTMETLAVDGEKACRRYLILAAKAARKMTKTARKNRPIERDIVMGRELQFVTVYAKNGEPKKLHKHRFGPSADPATRLEGTWEGAKVIGNAGLAKRSWFWSLGRFGLKSPRPPIRGTSRLLSIRQATVAGYIKENRLDYIHAAMPAGWEQRIAVGVGNKIMGQARDQLKRRWARQMGIQNWRKAEIPNENLARYFLNGEST